MTQAPAVHVSTVDGPPPPSALGLRSVARVSLEAEVVLRRSGLQKYRVLVYDISAAGCRIEFVERPDHNELLWVKFEGLDSLEALVCWTRPPLAGLQFRRPIYPAVFELLLSRLRVS